MGFFSRKLLRIFHPGIFCEQLEERIVLNAAIASPGQNKQSDLDDGSQHDALLGTVSQDTVGLASEPPDIPENLGTVFENDLNVVLVSKALDALTGLSGQATDHHEVVVFDETADGLDTITGMLADLATESGGKIATLAVLTHGDDGGISLGTDHLNYFNWTQYQTALTTLASNLSADAQIQFYACSLAGDFFGQAFVNRIAEFTGADVFASTNVTGGANGDWHLEYSSEAAPAMSAILDTATLGSINVELALSYPDYDNNWATAMDHVLYYVDDDGSSGKELWRSDGTGAGTYRLIDINDGKKGSDPAELTVVGGVLYFVADDGDNGSELWRSDGTAGRTEMVKDINSVNKKGSDPAELTVLDGVLYFRADDGINGVELWRSDGTEAGTEMVKDINDSGDSNPTELTVAGGKLFFVAKDGKGNQGHGNELWVHDPDRGLTGIVYDINPDTGNSNPTGFTEVNGILYFQADDGTHGVELWRTDGVLGPSGEPGEAWDGTSDGPGTGLVKDINKGMTGSNPSKDSNPAELTDVDGMLVFRADNSTEGVEIWVSDGTTDGTWRLTDINGGTKDSNPTEFTSVNGELYYAAEKSDTGCELWHSAIGWTNPGTVLYNLVLDINIGKDPSHPTKDSSTPRFLFDYDGLLLFAADDGIHGYEMWQSDGTDVGTKLLRDINPGAGSSFPANFARVNPLFFLAKDGNDPGYKLWKSDGTPGGTVKVGDVKPDEVVSIVPNPVRDDTAGLSPGGTPGESNPPPRFTSAGPISPNDLRVEPDTGQPLPRETLEAGSSGPVQLPPASEASHRAGEPEGTAQPGPDHENVVSTYAEFVPEHPKVTVLAVGHYSISSATLSLTITPNVWLPPMVKWYLVAVGEGRFRPGSLPAGYESMIWDYLGHVKDRLGKGQKPLEEMESRLAWQWAEWRKQVMSQKLSPDVLPWSYFSGLSDALAAFYQKNNGGVSDFNDAVKTMRHNAESLTIIPVKLPEETLLRVRAGEPGG